jgi:hypothetical protein
MTNANMKKFAVLYLTPPSVLDEWAKTDPAKKKEAEQKMMAEWNKWMAEHANMIISTDAGGKTKCVTPNGVSDTRNDIMLYSVVQAESHEAAAKPFLTHPHLQIPQASVEVMEIRPM